MTSNLHKIYSDLPKGLQPVPEFQLTSDSEYELLDITGGSAAGQTLEQLKFLECHVKNFSLGQATVTDIRITNSKFEDCDLANAKCTKALAERTEFIKCRMTGFKSPEAVFKNVLFKNCQCKLSQFRFCKFKNVTFEHCILEEADFYGADLTGAVFSDCDLLKADFSSARMHETDLRTSKIAGISVNIESLKGAIIDVSQVNDLAWLLGVKIEWKE